MEAVLTSLGRRLDEIRAYLTGLDLRDALLGLNLGIFEPPELGAYKTHIEETRLAEATVEYSASIVLLYGAWERFIEDLVEGFVGQLNETVPTFDQLPQAVRESHTDKSAELLLARRQQKYQGRLNEGTLIENLRSCTSTPDDYTLNREAFSQHTQNCRIEVVQDMFNNVGVAGLTARIKQHNEFRELMNSSGRADLASTPDSAVFSEVNDLASRRNEIAHGEPSDTLSRAILTEYIELVRVLARSIYWALSVRVTALLVEHHGLELPPALETFGDNVVGFPDTPCRLRVADTIVARSGRGMLQSSPIRRIEVDGEVREWIEPEAGEDFGVQLDFKVKKNWKYVIVPNSESEEEDAVTCP